MKKLIKWFSVFAVIGTAVGLVIAYFCKNTSDTESDAEDIFSEDEDFDLDADLQPAGREYVSLNKEESSRSSAADSDSAKDSSTGNFDEENSNESSVTKDN